MSQLLVAVAALGLARALSDGTGQPGVAADLALDSLWWLGSVSLGAVVAMVVLELGKSFPPADPFRRLADRATWPLVALALAVIVLSGYRLAEIIGFAP
jgi:hypothetical protein